MKILLVAFIRRMKSMWKILKIPSQLRFRFVRHFHNPTTTSADVKAISYLVQRVYLVESVVNEGEVMTERKDLIVQGVHINEIYFENVEHFKLVTKVFYVRNSHWLRRKMLWNILNEVQASSHLKNNGSQTFFVSDNCWE